MKRNVEATPTFPRWRSKLDVARLEPYGLAILIGLLIVLPLMGAQLGIDLDVVSRALAISTSAIIEAILHITGNI